MLELSGRGFDSRHLHHGQAGRQVLACLFIMNGHILIITGERGIGKTTVCQKTVNLARKAGLVCGGILTIADGKELYAVDVRRGDQRRLTTSGDGVRQGRFTFDPQVLAWGNIIIAQSVPCDLLVIDELGPLEFHQGGGWTVALDVLATRRFNLALAVVRPELVMAAQLRLPSSATVFTVTEENRDRLSEVLGGWVTR